MDSVDRRIHSCPKIKAKLSFDGRKLNFPMKQKLSVGGSVLFGLFGAPIPVNEVVCLHSVLQLPVISKFFLRWRVLMLHVVLNGCCHCWVGKGKDVCEQQIL